MDLHHLKIFLAVFKKRSFTKASKELYLSQPTVSDHIRSLENELGCRLFDRMGRMIIPTKEAEVLYENASEIMEKASSLKNLIGKSRKDVSGEIIIGASTIPGTYLMPPIMALFQNRYPDILFQILVADSKVILEKVLKHELMIGIVGTRLNNPQINYLPFIEDELIAVCSPALIKKDRMNLGELVSFPVLLREEGSGTRRETENILEKNKLSLEDLKIAGIFGSTDAIKQAVKTGMGISILSKLSARDELKYEILKEIKLTDLRMKRQFYLITHRKRNLPPPYNAFLTFTKNSQR